ncbi:MAG TPA: potassium channel family protein [Vicinamibacteria bacterium]|nr:potassium channel family protein [Vicinamibacteria bacterium]
MNALRRVGQRIDHTLREGFANEHSQLYREMHAFIMVLIFVSVISVTLASMQDLYVEHELIFEWSEIVIVSIFTAEFLINIYVAEDRKRYLLGWGIIDFLAIAPTILLMLDIRALKVARVLRVLRFLRLMRILRVLKLAKVAAQQFERRREQRLNTLRMDLQIYFIALFSAVTIFSTLEFYAEEQVPGTLFVHIPATMWWCMVTITTTGYGDMVPATPAGKVVAAATMLAGLALFGLLMNVVGKAMLSSLFGSTDLDAHDETVRKGEALVAQKQGKTAGAAPSEAAVAPSTAGSPAILACSCGEALNPLWRLCPHCGTPTPRGARTPG